MRPRIRAPQRGSAILELACSASALLLVAVGLADFARVFSAASVVAGAARAGVQTAMQDSGAPASRQNALNAAAGTGFNVIVNDVKTYCVCHAGDTAPQSCPATCGGSDRSQQYTQVTAHLNFTTLIRYPGIPNTTPLQSTATVRIK